MEQLYFRRCSAILIKSLTIRDGFRLLLRLNHLSGHLSGDLTGDLTCVTTREERSEVAAQQRSCDRCSVNKKQSKGER